MVAHDPNDLLSLTDFARLLGISRMTVHRWLDNGFPCIVINGRRWISLVQLRNHVTPLYEHLKGGRCNDL